MVHWVGEGSNVIICLARDSTPVLRYLGGRFSFPTENKTDQFRVSSDPDAPYAVVDKFTNHPKYYQHCVFVDSLNNLIFITYNNGITIQRVSVPFHPSEVSFYKLDPRVLVALDKVDPMRKLWLSTDRRLVWIPIHQFVKAFFWSPVRVLLVERTEPNGLNTVLKLDLRNFPWYQRGNNPLRVRISIRKDFIPIIENVEDFQMRGDYMFATRKRVRIRITELYVEYLIRFRIYLFLLIFCCFYSFYNRMERNIWISLSLIRIRHLSKRILTQNWTARIIIL